MIWIGYTTLYREGGRKFARAAETLRQQKEKENPGVPVHCRAVESKREFRAAMQTIAEAGESIAELHFIGHSGVYGIMFGSTAWPEQFSPHEWRELTIPFAPQGKAFFHACRTSRWFAPFFARTFGVPTWGYYWYTCFSLAPDRFIWDRPQSEGKDSPLYIISISGKKSHGILGSAMKYTGFADPEPMLCFTPEQTEPDTSYNGVAALYDEAFADITVREDEWKWLKPHILQHTGQGISIRVLDIGCGNGSLLAALAPHIAAGVGVDASPAMIDMARQRFGKLANLQFEPIPEPTLPFGNSSFDLIISFMSFRYLDWDPIMAEIRRVLAPGGRILIVDMAAAPVRPRDAVRFIRSKGRHLLQRRRHPGFYSKLQRLVSDPAWQQMLRYNPVRAEHEYRWYLTSRFPKGKVNVLNIGWTHRLLAFDSGPLEPGETPPLTYP